MSIFAKFRTISSENWKVSNFLTRENGLSPPELKNFYFRFDCLNAKSQNNMAGAAKSSPDLEFLRRFARDQLINILETVSCIMNN
jgi:hypothetical protein